MKMIGATLFIRYQKVRNTFVGTFAAIGTGVAAIFGYQSINEPEPRQENPVPIARNHQSDWETPTRSVDSRGPVANGKRSMSRSSSQQTAEIKNARSLANDVQDRRNSPLNQSALDGRYRLAMKMALSKSVPGGTAKDVLGSSNPWKLNLYDDNRDGQYDRGKLDTNRDEVDDEKWNFKNGRWEKGNGNLVWANDRWQSLKDIENTQAKSANPTLGRYQAAFRVANAKANPSGAGKDVLGASSSWKLNLYDDDKDGVWDRAKLDTNRDEVDDENWTHKYGRWEKNDGQFVWMDDKWVSLAAMSKAAGSSSNPKLARYRLAMTVAEAKADRTGVGKDVLGSASPWKFNLYDDDKDGKWDRAKLDTNRDEVDDESWTFKNGRWEKDSGKLVWTNMNWVSPSALERSAAKSSNPDQSRYQSAMKIAMSRSNSSGKGKDVLGMSSAWKVNLYDDDRDGTWDRVKVDMNRDDVDDEKWNFKNQRWEKDDGQMIWSKNKWVSSESLAKAVSSANDPNQLRYQKAMKVATARASRSGKGKDVLGASSPWKLNLYDDDKNGTWDRAKLDTNRDDVDDEKWNFKKGRWEKDDGKTVWDGGKWMSGK